MKKLVAIGGEGTLIEGTFEKNGKEIECVYKYVPYEIDEKNDGVTVYGRDFGKHLKRSAEFKVGCDLRRLHPNVIEFLDFSLCKLGDSWCHVSGEFKLLSSKYFQLKMLYLSLSNSEIRFDSLATSRDK